eukprot:10570903-Alexandrium_andersonii.AAC.1
MSASLVGSEMCIRDSTSSALVATCEAEIETRQSFLTGGRKQLQETGAVSYTHLTLPTICSV